VHLYAQILIDTAVHIFFTTFLTQIPIVHAPTFKAEKKSPVLLSAMQACGALFVGTRRATNFISKTLAYARETLVHDFVSSSKTLLRDRICSCALLAGEEIH
jgi:hypothetical protein